MHAEAGIGYRRSLVRNICTVVTCVIFVVDDEQNHAQKEADGAHSDVGNAKEGVLSSHPRDSAKDHPLAAIKAEHRVI